jgi:Cyclic nucleotide-binding domain
MGSSSAPSSILKLHPASPRCALTADEQTSPQAIDPAADAAGPPPVPCQHPRRRRSRRPTGPGRATPRCCRDLPADPGAAGFGPLHIIPFRPHGRPIDDADRPGAGCSESLGLVGSATSDDDDQLWILFDLAESQRRAGLADVRMSAWFLPGPASPLSEPVPVPGLRDVAVPPRRVGSARQPSRLRPAARFEPGNVRAYVAALHPRRDLLPAANDSSWSWEDADPALRAATPDGRDPFTFAHLFQQRVRVELAVKHGGHRSAHRSIEVEVFDVDRFGSLYERLINQLVRVDARRQAERRGVRRVYEAYHPWYPVLGIGLAKAKLYLRAVREDVSWQRRNLADPSWLMRVGIYLEFLTCLGIIEAVRDDYPDLLTPAERNCFENSPAFAEIRRRIDPAAWRRVWGHRDIVFAGNPLTSAGPVDFRNLVQKETANLAFLEAHHADLLHAIELAGPNLESGQQTWQRVFRDAERAVLDSSRAVFPEFRHLGPPIHEFVLWHEAGRFPVPAGELTPSWLTRVFGDRDGLYPTAARRYRQSMNEVAAWSKQRGLMDYAGDECVPRSASLIESQLRDDTERFSSLQAADGFAAHDPAAGAVDRSATLAGLLRTVKLFEPLTVSEFWRLVVASKRREYRAGDTIIREGQPASALNVIERGRVEVSARQPDGSDLVVASMGAADVFGEFSLITGQATPATVRACDPLVVHRIPKSVLQPILAARPELVVELSVLLASRRANRRTRTEEYLFGSSGPPDSSPVGRLVSWMRDVLLT